MGILHAYKSPEAKNLAFDYDPDGYWYPVRISNMVLAYNPEKFSKDEVAQSLKDFAYDENLKGMISMSNPLTSGTALASAVALSQFYGGKQWCRRSGRCTRSWTALPLSF